MRNPITRAAVVVLAGLIGPVLLATPASAAPSVQQAPSAPDAVSLPNYHWNASTIAIGSLNGPNTLAWTRLCANCTTDDNLGWRNAWGIAYATLGCVDLWSTPSDGSHLGWTFVGRHTFTAAAPYLFMSETANWKYVMHRGIYCP